METVVKALYNASFAIWNTLIGIAMTIFRTSPTVVSGGSPYGIVHSLYTSISAATIPIATCFFVIAIYKSVVTAPPEQQAQRFLMDGVRYCIILFVAANLWQILGYIMEFSDGITATLGGGAGYMLSMDGDLERIISESLVLPEFELSGEWIGKLFETLGCCILLLIGGVVLILVMVASSLSIRSSAFERIRKPLVVMPFAGIAVAMGAGGPDVSRSMVQFLKTFFGFCISGAMMVVIIKTGCEMCTELVSDALYASNDIENCIMITVQASITPIVIAGLVKGTDGMIQRMF